MPVRHVGGQYVGVDAQRHDRVCVAKPGGHHMYRNPGEEKRGRVQVTQIVQAGMGSA